MRRSHKLAVAALAGVVATAANAHAAPMASDGGVRQVSKAALEQILDRSDIQLVAKKQPRPYTQESGPVYVKFEQMILPRKRALLETPAIVASVFESLKAG